MSELQRPEEEHFFLRQEMRCKALEHTGPERWVFLLYEALSDFGYSITRPAYALAALWLSLALVFDAGRRLQWGPWPEGFDGAWLHFGLSFANLFGFLGFHRLYLADFIAKAPGWVAVLGGIQTILGVILLFFLGLGLRNRFRLK